MGGIKELALVIGMIIVVMMTVMGIFGSLDMAEKSWNCGKSWLWVVWCAISGFGFGLLGVELLASYGLYWR